MARFLCTEFLSTIVLSKTKTSSGITGNVVTLFIEVSVVTLLPMALMMKVIVSGMACRNPKKKPEDGVWKKFSKA